MRSPSGLLDQEGRGHGRPRSDRHVRAHPGHGRGGRGAGQERDAPIFKDQPGFIRYGVALLDNGKLASVSCWETHDEAEAAVKAAASFVKENMADVIKLEESHVGDFFFDESA